MKALGLQQLKMCIF